ncbi:ABC transporter substrate-binding protein [Afipia sp. P52-10]|jgi:tripartite-type tricarboxylate transporter receptor subunit TctC|uniref:Bug family tripartite tricarboxylate transporter substrate binding protein n=1 Tax=Afipia sp. P52-10 TaxID=1429916 RepID=UPI0003DF3164|nr:tripartite tricarboxylate transporter substrate binding protein [Afipia sp. P52-10]ETR76300.1 ABC transporter substrate-binding protein [Afipia sp. P52-10]
MNRREFTLSLAAASALVAGASRLASAAEYPTRAVKIICPFAPGGSGDISARLFADHFKTATGQTLVVENRTGASGGIGAAAVKSSDPDGYTLMLSTSSILIANELFYKTLPYDPRDFATVGIVGSTGMFMLVNPATPYKTVAEFIAYAKANPKDVLSAHFNTSSRIGAAIFAARAGLTFNEIPYKDVGQAVTDLIGGRLTVVFLDTVAAAQHIQGGGLRALGITTGERNKLYPDVPALAETFPGLEVFAFLSVSAPAKTPRDIQEKLNKLVVETIQAPAIQPRLEQLGLISKPMDLAAVDAFVETERKRWAEYVKIAKIEKE